jgi:aspartate racemase
MSEPVAEGTLGIIAGAGVGASVRLYADVAAGFRARAGSLPRIVLWNAPFSDALEHAFVGGRADGEEARAAERLVAEAIDRLLDAGATAIAMPCNSLQLAAAREAELRGAPFIDMVAATLDAVRESGHDAAVLIATEATEASGIYEGHGVEILPTPVELRAELASLIGRAVAGPAPSDVELRSLVERARSADAAVVLGCTDICGLLDSSAADAPVVDSLACLVGRCVDTLLAGAISAA